MDDRISTFQEILAAQAAIVLDGGLATELEARGFDLDDPLWSAKLLIDRPEAIRQLHLDYLLAGADCITSASYQASIAGFAKRGFSEAESAELLRRSVDLAREARTEFLTMPASRRRGRPLVAASVGPYGAFLHDGSEYTGDYGIDAGALTDFHRDRLHILADAGADLLAVETIPALEEARVLLRLLRELPGARAWFSFSCSDARHTCHGEPIEAAGALLAAEPAVCAVGINCTAPRFIDPLLRRLQRVTDKPLVVYPNSGERWDAIERHWVGESDPVEFAKLAARWHVAGARLIGGCCRTGPQHIRQLAKRFHHQPAP